ncbi:MAG: hypothetical protein IJ491_01500 [Clostridia bacterium]|nr:hypothetical protein [Clostridia bacterium]
MKKKHFFTVCFFVIGILLLVFIIKNYKDIDKIKKCDVDLIVNVCSYDCNTKEKGIDSYRIKYLTQTNEYITLKDFDHIHRAVYSENNKFFCAKKRDDIYVVKVDSAEKYSALKLDFLPSDIFVFNNSLLVLKCEENKSMLYMVDFENETTKALIDNIGLARYEYNGYENIDYSDVFVSGTNIIYKSVDGFYYHYINNENHNKLNINGNILGFSKNDTVIYARNLLFEGTEFSVDSIVEFNLKSKTEKLRRLVFFKPLESCVFSPDGRYMLTLSNNGEGFNSSHIYDLYSFASVKLEEDFVIDVFKSAQWLKNTR